MTMTPTERWSRNEEREWQLRWNSTNWVRRAQRRSRHTVPVQAVHTDFVGGWGPIPLGHTSHQRWWLITRRSTSWIFYSSTVALAFSLMISARSVKINGLMIPSGRMRIGPMPSAWKCHLTTTANDGSVDIVNDNGL